MSGPDAAGNSPLVQRRYVFGLLLRLCANTAGGVGILFVILYFALSRPLPGDYAGVFHALRNLSPFLRPILAISVLLYALLACGSTSALCIFILHKVAGPLYRMELVLEQYRSGVPTRTVSFRSNDQIQALAQAFNQWVGSLRRDRQRWLATMMNAERYSLQDDATCREKMEEALRKVAEDMARYR
jgi:HAMP domain-containing protein